LFTFKLRDCHIDCSVVRALLRIDALLLVLVPDFLRRAGTLGEARLAAHNGLAEVRTSALAAAAESVLHALANRLTAPLALVTFAWLCFLAGVRVQAPLRLVFTGVFIVMREVTSVVVTWQRGLVAARWFLSFNLSWYIP